MKKSWINGKFIVLTGASSGIGRELTKILIEKHNAKVLGIARNEEKMLKLTQELGEFKENFSFKLFDVSRNENWIEFSKFIEKEKLNIDILINCAGQLPAFDKFENYDLEVVENVINVNFYSAIYSIKNLMGNIKRSEKPMIVNISSSASLCAIPGTSIYSASKSALKAFSESLDSETDKNMRVSLICPGFTKTDIFRNQAKESKNALIDKISMPADKMARKIEKSILKRKRRAVIGIDAKLMNLLYKFFPRSAARICGWVLKKFKVDLFDNVFNEKGKEKWLRRSLIN